ncbi:hypothetical protein L6164_034581 [Bauhinia variegata]|uniref:Uncharacterized protein n=1 Tax=Bauhinia variegata TaxID=167791 RepID=A0ACB9KWP8_BAUVA|nr:hypothetical protein L6164_034581 [Bauhinia variegata]
MATLEDICVSAALNLLSTLTFLVASGIWRLQPFNGRVYFPKCITDAQPELINHGGLDSAVYIRINLLGLKIFAPITLLSLIVLVPVNWMGKHWNQPKNHRLAILTSFPYTIWIKQEATERAMV